MFLLILLLRVEDEKHSQEVSQFQQELAEARSQLQLLQKRLDEKLSEQPLVSQEVKAARLLCLSLFMMCCVISFLLVQQFLIVWFWRFS